MKTIPVRRCAYPITRHVDGSRHAVLGLHGFGGYPGELALPVQRLAGKGISVVVPRLPGHGTNQEDFDRSTGRDWYTAAREAYLELSQQYDEISVIGHSMGGILALLLAEEFDIGKIVLFAPAMQIISPVFRYVGILKFFRHRIRIEWEADTSVTFFDTRDPDDDEFLGHEYWGWLNVKQINEMRKLQRQARRSLQDIRSSLLVLTGGKDPTVPESVGPMLKQQVSGEVNVIHLREACHLIPYDPHAASRETAMQEMEHFLS